MSIIQISKITHRTGNLVDLPQLDAAELGWANDHKRLFVGTSTPNPAENVEVLTSYSNISFSQIDGAGANLNLVNSSNGEVMTFNGVNWVNRGGAAGGLINLGDPANVKISGGAIGYVLETDGTGNLSWTSKGSLRVSIQALSNATPIVMTVPNTTPYTSGMAVSISGVEGVPGTTVLNGNTFYVSPSPDFALSGNVNLYTDSALTSNTNGTSLTYTNSPNAVAISSLVSTGGGGGAAGGSNTSVLFNKAGVTDGSSTLTFDYTTNLLTVTGNANVTANLTSGNANLGNLATANFFSGNGSPLTSLIGANVLGAVTLATTANSIAGGAAGYLPYQSAANTTQLLAPVAIGSYLASNGGAAPFWATNPAAPGNGAITVANGVATTNVSVSLYMSNVFGADSTIGTVMSANVGPALGNLTAAMGNATTGFLKKTAADTYSLDTSTYLTSYTDTLASVTGRGNTTTTPISTTNATTSTSTSTGALIVSGGAGVGGNIYAGNFYTAGLIQTPNLTTGANTTVGNITGNWTLTTGSKLQATYADLAEKYVSDGYYNPGTIMEFGGENEVTLATANTTKVAGVISANPAYVMNAECEGPFVVDLALQGRVPVLVIGDIYKGDMIVSAGGGYGCACAFPIMGQVIGKSLEYRSADSDNNMIEVAVGRL